VRVVAALVLVLVVAVPALAGDEKTYVRSCSSSAYGDLGRDWRRNAVVAGRLAFVGMAGQRRAAELDVVGPGRANPLKVLVVVEPGATPTLTIARASRGNAALGYNPVRHDGSSKGVPLADGTTAVRFNGCRAVASREPWNRGTQFPGYFLVARAGCVQVEVQTQGTILRRTLRFGVPRCG
jgi:hypothetical protein